MSSTEKKVMPFSFCDLLSCDDCCSTSEKSDSQLMLRRYAYNYLGAPELEYNKPAKGSTELTPNEFSTEFRRCLRTRGWEVWKVGRGKKVPRKLMVSDDGVLTWGSKKDDDARKTIAIKDIDNVVRQPAADAPQGADPDASLCIIINDGTALKLLCNSVTDALVLVEGFKVLNYHFGSGPF